jgi:hypothetical protein
MIRQRNQKRRRRVIDKSAAKTASTAVTPGSAKEVVRRRCHQHRHSGRYSDFPHGIEYNPSHSSVGNAPALTCSVLGYTCPALFYSIQQFFQSRLSPSPPSLPSREAVEPPPLETEK